MVTKYMLKRQQRKKNPRKFYKKLKKGFKSGTTWKQSAYNMAKTAAWGLLKYYVNTEEKYNDVTLTAVRAPYDNPILQSIPLLVQGTTASTRTGDSIKLTRINIRLNLQCGSTLDQRIRVMLIRDSQCNGTAASQTNIMLNNSMESPLNIDFAKRFIVLHDAEVHVDSVQYVNVSHVINKTNLQDHIEYGGNAGTVADLRNTNYYLYIISDKNNASGQSAFVSGNIRFRYIDN